MEKNNFDKKMRKAFFTLGGVFTLLLYVLSVITLSGAIKQSPVAEAVFWDSKMLIFIPVFTPMLFLIGEFFLLCLGDDRKVLNAVFSMLCILSSILMTYEILSGSQQRYYLMFMIICGNIMGPLMMLMSYGLDR